MVRRNSILSGLIASVVSVSTLRTQNIKPSDAEIEQFLTAGRLVSSNLIGQGVTKASRATLSLPAVFTTPRSSRSASNSTISTIRPGSRYPGETITGTTSPHISWIAAGPQYGAADRRKVHGKTARCIHLVGR